MHDAQETPARYSRALRQWFAACPEPAHCRTALLQLMAIENLQQFARAAQRIQNVPSLSHAEPLTYERAAAWLQESSLWRCYVEQMLRHGDDRESCARRIQRAVAPPEPRSVPRRSPSPASRYLQAQSDARSVAPKRAPPAAPSAPQKRRPRRHI